MRLGEEAVANLEPDRLMRPEAVAEAYWTLHTSNLATPGPSSRRSGPSARRGERRVGPQNAIRTPTTALWSLHWLAASPRYLM